MDVSLPSRGPLYDDKQKALFCFVPTRHFLQLRACLMRPYHKKYLELKKKVCQFLSFACVPSH